MYQLDKMRNISDAVGAKAESTTFLCTATVSTSEISSGSFALFVLKSI